MKISTLGIWSNNIKNSRFQIPDSRLLINKQSSPTSPKTTVGVLRTILNLPLESCKDSEDLVPEILRISRGKSLIKSNGFTLLEISLVVLLIGMILSLALPNIGIHKSKLEKERQIEKISQTIKSVYDLSQVQNKEIILLFDLDENKFQAFSSIGEEREYVLPEKKLSSVLKIKDIVNFEGDKITEGTVSLMFNPAGFVEPANIHFVDKDAKFYTLFINPLTGQSHVENGYWEEE